MKTAVIFGVSGMDGSHLADLLLRKDYRVIGCSYFGATADNFRNLRNIAQDNPNFVRMICDMSSATDIMRVLSSEEIHEVYNMAAQNLRPASWGRPAKTVEINTNGLSHILSILWATQMHCRVFQPTSAGMFGSSHTTPCTERTAFRPETPYDVSKVAAHYMARVYRDVGMHVATCILFAHESPRRCIEMVSKKIARTVAFWKRTGNPHDHPLALGDLDAMRDVGWAPDYVEAMYRALQQDVPMDYVLGTGKAHSVREFVQLALAVAELPAEWINDVLIDEKLKRPQHISAVAGTARAQNHLGWDPNKTSYAEIVRRMVEYEIQELSTGV